MNGRQAGSPPPSTSWLAKSSGLFSKAKSGEPEPITFRQLGDATMARPPTLVRGERGSYATTTPRLGAESDSSAPYRGSVRSVTTGQCASTDVDTSWTARRSVRLRKSAPSASDAAILLDAVAVMDPRDAAEVFSANDELAQNLLQMWSNDDELSSSNCSREAIVSLDVASEHFHDARGLTVDAWGHLILDSSPVHSCGCYGGSLWRVRYGKQPKLIQSSAFLSKLLAWWSAPAVPPLLNDCEADPDVEVLRMQYMGERSSGPPAKARRCIHADLRGYYFGCGEGLEAKLIRMTPSVEQRQIALMVYQKDRLNGRCELFAVHRRLRLVQREDGGLGWRDRGSLVLNFRQLLDTTRGANVMYSRQRRDLYSYPVAQGGSTSSCGTSDCE